MQSKYPISKRKAPFQSVASSAGGDVFATTLNGDSLAILHRNKPIVVLFRHRLHAFWCRLGQLLNKPACRSHARQPLECLHQIENKPGEPRNTAKAGTTVFGGRTVLSSIFAQSLIMQNFPCRTTGNVKSCHSATAGVQGNGWALKRILKGLSPAYGSAGLSSRLPTCPLQHTPKTEKKGQLQSEMAKRGRG